MSEPDFYSKDKKEYYKRKSGGSNRKKEYSKLIRVNNMQFFNEKLCFWRLRVHDAYDLTIRGARCKLIKLMFTLFAKEKRERRKT